MLSDFQCGTSNWVTLFHQDGFYPCTQVTGMFAFVQGKSLKSKKSSACKHSLYSVANTKFQYASESEVRKIKCSLEERVSMAKQTNPSKASAVEHHIVRLCSRQNIFFGSDDQTVKKSGFRSEERGVGKEGGSGGWRMT